MRKVIREEELQKGEGVLHHKEGVDLIPANLELSSMEMNLVNAMSRELTLRNYLKDIKKDYEYILIDCMKHKTRHRAVLGSDVFGNITRLDNALENIEKKLKLAEEQHENLLAQYETAKTEVTKEVANEDELNEKTKRLDELNILLNIDKKGNEILDEKEDTAVETAREAGEIERRQSVSLWYNLYVIQRYGT
ncbi:Sporulation initiation inhibitor protein soj [uncultured Roseburia sp.]|nr:Sporulation initiation inhibitor protein soj [uncultured Roseburia sp.]